ncbi:MAG: hypothetical protein Q8N83_03815 [Ignavibacteria bacterium]|nr:hypothetical protein [Ignavibacteria bacterium]
MKYLIFLLFTCQMIVLSQTEKTENSPYDFDLKANHLVREQFYSLSAVYPFYKSLFVEVEYGYVYYHRAGISLGYRFKQNNYTPFVIFGVIYQRENFTKNTHYDESCLKLGVGLETELSNHFFFNFETSALNYLSINYSMRKIKYRENYDFGESFDYTVSVGIGYRFHF